MIIFDYKDVFVTVQNPLSSEVFCHRICEGTEQIRCFTDCYVFRTYAIMTSYKAYIFDS